MRTLVLLLVLIAPPAAGQGDPLLDLARQGWVYQLRTTMLGRDAAIPVDIHPRNHLGGAICTVGDPPDAQTLSIIAAFSDLVEAVFGAPLPHSDAGDVTRCGPGPQIVLRLYSGYPLAADLTRDIDWLNRTYGLGLRSGQTYVPMAPAQGQTFFGRRGMATHLVVPQAGTDPSTPLEHAYFASVLIEELYQSFSFGMDILHFDRNTPLVSKLEERPLNLRGLAWTSSAFMEGMLASSPAGLCRFDLTMLLALAAAPLEQSNDQRLLIFLDRDRDRFRADAERLFTDVRFGALIDGACP